jgi:hypothetical protein
MTKLIFRGFVLGNKFQFSEYMNMRAWVHAYVFVRTVSIIERTWKCIPENIGILSDGMRQPFTFRGMC